MCCFVFSIITKLIPNRTAFHILSPAALCLIFRCISAFAERAFYPLCVSVFTVKRHRWDKSDQDHVGAKAVEGCAAVLGDGGDWELF